MRRGNARLNLLQRPRIPGRWKCTNILQKGGFAAELGTSYSSQRRDSPALFLLEYKAFLTAEFVRVSPNCLDHAPLTRSRADYAPAVRLRDLHGNEEIACEQIRVEVAQRTRDTRLFGGNSSCWNLAIDTKDCPRARQNGQPRLRSTILWG